MTFKSCVLPVTHSLSPFQTLSLSFCMQQHLLQSSFFPPTSPCESSKNLLSFSPPVPSPTLFSHHRPAVLAQLSLHTDSLLFKNNVREQPKPQRRQNHCTMTISLNSIAPSTDDIMYAWGKDACLFFPMFCICVCAEVSC